METDAKHYDVCVVGSGPAGSTAATFVAMRGHRVLLVEKETLPVYKIGESLLPATIHGICNMLGISEELSKQNFVRKLGGTFRWGKNKDPWTFAFAESSRFQGPTSYAYQVERIKFDTILLNNARRKGVEVWEEHRVEDLLLSDGRVSGLKIIDRCGSEKVIRCKYVIDASGHASTIARYAGNRIFSKFFQNIAVFGYFNDGHRLPPPNTGNIFCVAFEKGWFWYIPLSEALTSVGAVIGEEYSSMLRTGYDAAFLQLVESCVPIHNLLSKARLCDRPPYDEIRVRKDYSYSHSALWKPGFVLVGDAACFIDPVFSSGVHLATYSALLAARSVNSFLEGQLTEEVVFKEFESRYRREYKLFYDFLTAFYNLDHDSEGYYWTARVLMNSDESGNHAFLSLIGGDASGELMYGSASNMGKQPITASQLFPAASGNSRDMYYESGNQSSERRQFWGRLNAEGFRLQLRSALQNSLPPERPLFENGLVPSADGLLWVSPAATNSRPSIKFRKTSANDVFP
jgi:halogenation protein CepH